MEFFCKPLQATQSAKIMIDRNNPLHIFLSSIIFKYVIVDAHALVTPQKENYKHTLLR